MNKLVKSFGWALNGLKTVWFEEVNFRIEFYLAIIVISSAVFFSFNFFEWALVFVAIILVLTGEIINTAVEDLCDKIEPRQDPLIGKIKDTMAGYVLLMSAGACLLGLSVFINHFLS